MKFTTVLAVLAAFAATAVAESNGERLARGMSPHPPVRRASSTTDAEDHRPSGYPRHPHETCSTGRIQCCNSVSHSSNPHTRSILEGLGLHVPPGFVPIGLNCSPLSFLGLRGLEARDLEARGNQCNAQTVCCEHDHFDGLVEIGCMPINIDL